MFIKPVCIYITLHYTRQYIMQQPIHLGIRAPLLTTVQQVTVMLGAPFCSRYSNTCDELIYIDISPPFFANLRYYYTYNSGCGVKAQSNAWTGAYVQQNYTWILFPTGKREVGFDWEGPGTLNVFTALSYPPLLTIALPPFPLFSLFLLFSYPLRFCPLNRTEFDRAFGTSWKTFLGFQLSPGISIPPHLPASYSPVTAWVINRIDWFNIISWYTTRISISNPIV